MKIGIDITPLLWGQKAGIGWYSYNLIKNMSKIDKENLYVLYGCSIKQYKEKFRLKKDLGTENFHISIKPFPNRVYNYSVQTFLPVEFFHGRFDIIHNLHPFSPLCLLSKHVITIHDVTPLINPDWFLPLHSKKFKFIISKAVKRSSIIIADSFSTKTDIVKFFNIDPEKIYVVHLAADEIYKPIENKEEIENIKKKYGITKKYILFVGTIEPRKNLVRLISVFEKIKEKIKDYQLVIAGQTGWKPEKFFKKLNEIPEYVRNDIKLTGYLPISDLPFLYNGCEVFIYPSLYEGFGLPVLEAMACGVPVITSNISSLPEVAGDACIMVNPEDEEEMEEAILNLLNNESLRKELAIKGLKRAKLFSWEKTAMKTVEIYKLLK